MNKSSMHSSSRIGLLTTGFLALATISPAAIVLVDVGNSSTFRGLPVSSPDANGNTWNSVWSGAFYGDLLDTTGTASGISFGFVTAPGADSFNGPAGATDSGTLASDVLNTDIDAAALGVLGGALEGAFDYYVDSVISIQGLDSSLSYTLDLFGSHKFNTDDTTVYTLYSADPTDADNTGGAPVLDSASLEVFLPGSPWLHNRDTVATMTISGQTGFYLGFTGAGGDSGYLNALSITVVPEPGSLGLWAAGVLAMGVFLTRRRR
jgi:hypothetical protein